MKFPTRETVKGVVDMVGVPEDEALNIYQGRGGFGHGVLDERIVVTNSRSAVSRGKPVTIKLHMNSTITSWIHGRHARSRIVGDHYGVEEVAITVTPMTRR